MPRPSAAVKPAGPDPAEGDEATGNGTDALGGLHSALGSRPLVVSRRRIAP
jgi:hypothetical protein